MDDSFLVAGQAGLATIKTKNKMEVFGVLALFFLGKFLYGLWKKNQEEKERLGRINLNVNLYDQAIAEMDNEGKEQATNNSKTFMEINKETKDLFLDTLSKIGCQYELGEGEDVDKVYFAYQGENFTASANNEGWYVHIWDTHWGHVELYDIEEFARLRKAINLSNLNCSTMTVYTIDEASSSVDVHCKSVIPFIPQIPELENYLRGELNDFFRAHQLVGNEMEKQREAIGSDSHN